METPRPPVQSKDVAPKDFVDLTLAAEPLDFPHEPFTAFKPSNSHQKTNSTALAAPRWSPPQPSLSPTTPAPRIAIAATYALFSSSLEQDASNERQGAPSLVTSLIAPRADEASNNTIGIHLSSSTPPGGGDKSSHGSLPQWAYFYDPALTHAQVRYIESQMRSQDEYQKLPPDQRQSVVVKDLQQALSSMRLVYSRSTNVAHSTTDDIDHELTSPTATNTDATSQSARDPAEVFSVENAILAEQTGGNMVTQNCINAETLRDKLASVDPTGKNSNPPIPASPSRPTSKDTANIQATQFEGIPAAVAAHSPLPTQPTMTPFPELALDASPRQSRGQPVYSLTRPSGSYIHGKRAENGDEVMPKRQRLESSLVTDENGRASIVSTSYVSRPAGSSLSSELPLQAGPIKKPAVSNHSQLSTEPHRPIPALPESSLSSALSSDDDIDNSRAPSGKSRGREWPPEDAARLAKARADGQPWDTIMQVSYRE